MAGYQGDIVLGDTIDIKFVTTSASTGAPTQLAGTPVISAYVGNSTTQITAGITLSVDFDGVTGLNNVRVVASGGNGYAAATNVSLIITTGTVGGTSAVGYEVGSFSIQNRGISSINGVAATSVTTINANLGTTQPINFSGTGASALAKSDMVDIAGAAVSTTTAQIGVNLVNIRGTASAGAVGYVGIDWSAINAPTTTVNLSGTTVKTATDVEADTQDIQSRLPAALTAGGNIKADALAISGDTTAADNAESFFDGTGYAGTNNVIPTVTTLTNLPSIPNNWLTAAGIAAGALNGKGDWNTTTPPTVSAIATAVWQDTTAGDFTVASSIGKSLYTSGNAPGTASGLSLVGSNMGTVTNVTGTLTTTERDAIADALLNRDMSTGTDSGSSTVRTPRQALRALRNRNDTTTLTVYKEDDTTASWTYVLTTDAAADPITVINPAGP